MLVFYTKNTHRIIGWCRETPNLVISSDGVKSEDLVLRGVNWDKVEYRAFPDQDIQWKIDEETEARLSMILEELGLRDFTPEELLERQKLSKNLFAEIDEIKTILREKLRVKFIGDTV